VRVEVRPATVEDARGIAQVHVSAWQEAYAHLAPAEALARLNVVQRELRWIEILGAGATTTHVAVDDGRIVGFASSSRGHAESAPHDLELESIYVLASHHGNGAAQRLLDGVLGDEPACLWVANDNPRARAFYTRNGFAPDGSEDTHSIVGTPVLAIRMVRG
jgi:GNAT superfamily N-acetyltransferase